MRKLLTSSKNLQNYYSEIFAESFQDKADITVYFSGIKITNTIYISVSICYTCTSEKYETAYKEYVTDFILNQLKYQSKYTQKDFFNTDNIVFMKQEVVGKVDKLPPQIYYSLHSQY